MSSTLSTPPPPAVWPAGPMYHSDDDDDDDEINSANARVFFGALKSPELKFAHLHTPKPRRAHAAQEPAPSAVDAQPEVDLISFDAGTPAPATAVHVDDGNADLDLFDTTTVLDAPPLQPASMLTPSRIALPPSPLTAEDDMEVEQLLPTTAASREPSALAQKGTLIAPDHISLPISQDLAAPTPQPESVPRTPTRASLEEPSHPTFTPLDRPVSHGAQEPGPALDISISLSPARLQTPKRKHQDAFRAASPDQTQVRKKQFGAQRLPAANDAPRKPGPPKSSAVARRPVQRPPMLGSLSPESDGMLTRLLAPSSGPNTNISLNINIDFSRLPSFGACADEVAKENISSRPAAAPSPSRSTSPKRIPVSVVFRSPSPPRRVLVSPQSQSSPAKGAPRPPFSTSVRAPFPLSATLTIPEEQPQPSPVKTSRVPSSLPSAPSSLRQPTLRAVSKLPKPKPYAPPHSKLPAPSTSSIPKPLGLASRPFKGLGVTKVVPSPPHATAVPQSSPAPQPIMIRQVIPGMFSGKTDPVKDAAMSRLRSNYGSAGPLSPTRERVIVSKTIEKVPIPIRRVIPGTLRHYEGRPPTPPPVEVPIESTTREQEPSQTSTSTRVGNGIFSSSSSFNSASSLESETVPVASSSKTLTYELPSSPSPPPRPSVDSSPIVPDRPGRRSSRNTAKPPAESKPVKLVKPESRIKPVPDDLKTQARKLQALTTANTTHNDGWQVAVIETRIVRRPGPRPPSPSSKLRTESETRRDDASRERERRARRRAGEDVENDDAKRRHLKGPGDETEYETPDNNRIRGRYVRWDPGLVSTPQRRGADEPLAPSRSCLATPAPHKAGTPLPSQREKVIVTKFVYDDDEEATEVPPPSEPEAAGSSKAKGRKKKTASATAPTASAE